MGNDQPRERVRRRDRAVDDDAWIEQLLARAPIGTMTTVEDGQPYPNLNTFVLDAPPRVVYLHTARQGRTRHNVEIDARACFSVAEMGRILPASTALEFSVEYAGVVAFGNVRIVADPTEARRGLQMLLDKYAPHLRPGRDYRAITDEEIARTSVYRFKVEHWTGKRKAAPPRFPGAFPYRPAQGFEQPLKADEEDLRP